MMKYLAIIFLVIGLLGCISTIATIKNMPEGSGATKVYNYPYGKVFDASVNAIKNLQLEIVDINKNNKYIY